MGVILSTTLKIFSPRSKYAKLTLEKLYIQGYNSLMIEPEFDYTYLPWSLKFPVGIKLIDGQKVLDQLLLFAIFSNQL